MNQTDGWKMTPLDALLCSNQLQMLKILIFLFPPARQRQMILLIKLMELRQCLTLPISKLAPLSHAVDNSDRGPELLEHIFPYCDPEQQQTFRQMQNAFQMIKTVRQFSKSGLFDHLGEMMSSGGPATPTFSTDNDQISSLFSSMLTPEQMALFNEYDAMLNDL
ncbi:MAG: hypothetical protein IJA58_01485 [Lachnospiraceae bacterium]|nr:hypothetical protein [Lachnospiraceae bacterium]